MLDIRSDSTNLIAARLSNFTARRFIFENCSCSSIEAVLQSFKIEDPTIQKIFCEKSSRFAQKKGQEYNNWKERQILWWRGTGFKRNSSAYQMLLTRLYNAAFQGDSSFKDDLLATADQELCHSIGKTNMRETVLTESEMLNQLERLRELARRT